METSRFQVGDRVKFKDYVEAGTFLDLVGIIMNIRYHPSQDYWDYYVDWSDRWPSWCENNHLIPYENGLDIMMRYVK